MLPRRWIVAALAVSFSITTEARPSEDGHPAGGGAIHVLEIDGVINPVTARYLARGLSEAERQRAHAVVLRLDTPGGLERSMREMTGALLASRVPVIVFVSPAAARAASAGMFLTIAGHVAAMAPGTNIGAAHPVAVGGGDGVMSEKVVNDAAALARAIAQTRGRNADWAEQAVRKSVSVTADHALELGVIDVIAEDLRELLGSLDGRTVRTAAGAITLATADRPDSRIVESKMTLAERVLQAVADPNIAYLLFTLGFLGLLTELLSPGLLLPGVVGGISLLVALFAFGTLPINWAGVLLLALGVALLVLELVVESSGVLAAGGTVSFVLGSLILYRPFGPVSPALPNLEVSRWLIAVIAAGVIAFFMLVLRAVLRARRAPATTGAQALIGRAGIAVSDLGPSGGRVRIDSETWSSIQEVEDATAWGDKPAEPIIRAGEPVEVVAVEGVTLRVRRVGLGAEPVRGELDWKRS